MPFKRINASQAIDLIDNSDAHVVDIRDKNSYAAGRIANAKHISDANVGDFFQQTDRRLPLIVCCYHGNMSQSAADYFDHIGFEKTYSLDQGYQGWGRLGLEYEYRYRGYAGLGNFMELKHEAHPWNNA